MEARHPAGYDPESFRRADADTLRIPRRPARNAKPPVPPGPSQYNNNSSHGAQPSTLAPRQPLGRSSRDRIASPSYASLVHYPGIDDSIRRLARLAQFFGDPRKPSKEFLDAVETLSTRFIEHVANERGALQKKTVTKPTLPSRREVPSGRERNYRKRRTVHIEELSDSEESAPRKKTKPSRPRRNLAPVSYSDDDDQDVLHQTIPEQRAVLPRRSKENMPSMHEDILAAKSLPPSGRVIDVESEHRSNNSGKPPIPVDCDDDADVSDSDSDDSWVMPVVRPRPYVRDRPLVSDRTSLTPVIMDDDVDTDTEERKLAALRQQALSEARERRAMEQMQRARSVSQSTGAEAAQPFQTSQPHGVRLCGGDSVVIPIRGTKLPTGWKSTPLQCYNIINIPQSVVVLRDPPRIYNRNSPEGLISRKGNMSGTGNIESSGNVQQALRCQQTPQKPGAQEQHLSERFSLNRETVLVNQVRNEFNHAQGQGSAIPILPRVDHAAVGTEPILGYTCRQMPQSAVASAPTASPDVAMVSPHTGYMPNILEHNMAMQYRSLLQPASVQGVGGHQRRNGILGSTATGTAAVQNKTPPPYVGHGENYQNRGPDVDISSAVPRVGISGLRPGGHHVGNEKRLIPSRPSGSIDSSLGTMDIPQAGRKPVGPHSEPSVPGGMDFNMQRSLPSPVTPVQAQGAPGATFNGVPQYQRLSQRSQHGSTAGQSGLHGMQLNGMSLAMQGNGRSFIGNGMPFAAGLVRYTGQEAAIGEGVRGHVPLPAPVNGVLGGGVGNGLRANEMNGMTAGQHVMMNRNNLANFTAQHRTPHQLIHPTALHDTSHGVSANIYQAVYEEAYRQLYAQRHRQMEEERRRAEGNDGGQY